MELIINEKFRRLIPPLKPEEYTKLSENILKDGCRDSIVTWRGTVVDGHNRYRICQTHNLPFKTLAIEFPDEDHAELWIRFNQLGRRNLTDDQRAIMADAAAELESKLVRREIGESSGRGHKKSEDGASSNFPPRERTRSKAAKAAKVSERKMKKARSVRNQSPELAKQVESGELTLAAAERQIHEEARKKNLKVAEWPKGKFRVIYADPPWQYGDIRTGTQDSGGVVSQYETMSLDKICALPIRDLSIPDSVLFLWATSPLIPEAVEVIKAWGFKYKASFVWDKQRGFNGHYNDVQHELLLVATRGSCLPETKTLPKSIIRVEKDKHSKKPEAFRELIDTLYPTGPRLELFAREKSPGWESWGNETK